MWKINRHLTIDSNLSRNDVSLPVADGDFTTTLVGARLEAVASRELFAYALIQWHDVSNTLQTNVRIDGSKLPEATSSTSSTPGTRPGPSRTPGTLAGRGERGWSSSRA